MAQEKIEPTGGIDATIKATPKATQQLVSDAARAQELIDPDKLELAAKAVEDVCPQCSSTRLDIGEHDWVDDEHLYYEMCCLSCGLEFKQWFVTEFDGQTVGETDIPIDRK